MKIATRSGVVFQGDVAFVPIDALPEGLLEQPGEVATVAHSETGHNHSVHNGEATLFRRLEADPMVCYLQVAGDHADVIHHRAFDTHQTIRLLTGCWEVRRQREFTPEGLRRVED